MHDVNIRFNGLDSLDNYVNALCAFPNTLVGAHGVIQMPVQKLTEHRCARESKMAENRTPCIVDVINQSVTDIATAVSVCVIDWF